MNKLLIILAVILIIVIIYHCFPQNMIEGFPTSSPLPNIISAANFDQYFTVDTGIANCTNASSSICPNRAKKSLEKCGCPSDASDYITSAGVIDWQKGKSATFRTKNPVLPSGYGFVGFKLNSVPMGKNVWNSIWLMGKDNCGSDCSLGSLLEIDIYELNNTWWRNNGTNITVPKISFHDWQDGNGAKPKSDQGCFGVMLSGSTGGTNTATKQHSHCGGKIVKNWNWNLAKSQIYDGASWYTLVTKDSNNKPLVYVGISLKGWLPKSKSEATYTNVHANSDFLVSSGEGNIQGDPRGGYFFCLTSTTSSGDVSGEWNIPWIVNYDEKAEYKDTGCPSTTKSTDCDDKSTDNGDKKKKGDDKKSTYKGDDKKSTYNGGDNKSRDNGDDKKSTDNGDKKSRENDDKKSRDNDDKKSRDNDDKKSRDNDDKNQMQVSYHNGDLFNKKHKPNSYSFINDFNTDSLK